MYGVDDRRGMLLEELAKYEEILSAQGAEIPKQMQPLRRALRGDTGENVEYKIRRKDTGRDRNRNLKFLSHPGQEWRDLGSGVGNPES